MKFSGERYVPSEQGKIKYEHLHRYALSLEFVKDKLVLDIASGEGYGAALLATKAKAVTGVDIDSESIDHSRHRYFDPKLKFVVGSCDAVPLPDSSFEVVTSFETIEHHDKHEEMFAEFKRLLKPGGALIISSPNRLAYSDDPGYVNPFHVKELYYDEFCGLLGKYFKHVRIFGQKLATGSFVFPLEPSRQAGLKTLTGNATQIRSQICALPSPICFVAVCSDSAAIAKYELSSVYLDQADDLLAVLEQERASDIKRMQEQVWRTEQELQSGRTVYEAQIVRQTEETVLARTGYEAEISRQSDQNKDMQHLLRHAEEDLTRQKAGYEGELQRRAEETKSIQAGYEKELQRQAEAMTSGHKAEIGRLSDELRTRAEETKSIQAGYEKELHRQAEELAGVRAKYEAEITRQSDQLKERQRIVQQVGEDLVRQQVAHADEIRSVRTAYEAELGRQVEELGNVRVGYEAEIGRLAESLAAVSAHDRVQDEILAQARLRMDAARTQVETILSQLSEAHEHSSRQAAVLSAVYNSSSWRKGVQLEQIGSGNLVRRYFERSIRSGLPGHAVLKGWLDYPGPEDVAVDFMEIHGWAYSMAAPVVLVQAFVDGVCLGSLRYGVERPDVVEAFPAEAPLACGYAQRISIIGLAIEGEKNLEVRVYDEKGNKQSHSRALTFGPSAGLSFSIPAVPDLSPSQTLELFRTTSPASELSSQVEDVIAEFQDRFERDPSILDWNSGLGLARIFPNLVVFSPPVSGNSVLPYLDRSVDIVVTSSLDSNWISEAQRLAAVAVIRTKGLHSGRLQNSTSQRASKTQVSIDVIWQPEQVHIAGLPTASIIIPVYNKSSYTQNCLQALLETLPRNFTGEIIVVDDASSDETPDVLENWAGIDSRIKILRNAENAGFITSCNRGAEAASGEVLVFLNNDTLPLPGWLPPLLRVLRDTPDAGAVGGKLIYPDGMLQEAGGVIFSDGSGCNFGKHDVANKPLYNYLREVDYCSGALLATWRSHFMDVGGFDTRYKPAYYEDVDYCFSLREKGFRVYYQPESGIVHFEGASSGTDINSGVKSYQAVNRSKFVEKWSTALKSQPSAPDHYDFATLLTLSVRNEETGGHVI